MTTWPILSLVTFLPIVGVALVYVLARGGDEAANRNALTQKRDLAQQTHDALARKSEENKVSQGAGGHEVELASEASFASPTGGSVGLVLGGAALLGLVLAVAAAPLRGIRPHDVA